MPGDYLTKLRLKPKHVRDNIAFGIASSFTAVVALFLVLAVHGPKVVDEVAGGEDSPRFFETLVNQAKEQLAASRSSIEPVKNEANDAVLVPAPPAAGSTLTPAPAVLTATSSVVEATTSAQAVRIATTSTPADAVR